MIYRRDLINKRTNEVVLKSINYVYDFADNIYYVSDPDFTN